MTTAETAIAQPPQRRLWRNVSFTLMWTSTAASGFGDRMMMLAALALLGGLGAAADSTAIHASTQFWFFAPYILFSIPAGWLADRLPRKWLMLFCDEARGVTLLACFLLLAAATGPAELPVDQQWKVAAALFAIGVFASIFNPTRNAIIPQIIPKQQLPAANALILGINVIASMVGIYVGGEIIDPDAASSVRTGLLLGALFYLISGTFFAFLRPVQPAHEYEGVRERSVLQGLRYIVRHQRIMVLIGLNLMVWAAAAVVSSAILGLLKAHYAMAGTDLLYHYTRIFPAMGVGMLVGALFITLIGIRRESVTVLMLGVMGAGIAVLAVVAVPWLPMTYIAAFGVGFCGNIAIVAVITLLQSLSPNYVRGRIMGINSMVNTICSVTVYFMIWRMPNADTGIIIVLWVLGPALMLVGLAGLVRYLRSGPMQTPGLNVLWRLNRTYILIWHRARWIDRQHVPLSGPVILAANHTAGVDPFLIQAGCPRLVRWLMLRQYQFSVLNVMWKRIKPITLSGNTGDTSSLREIIRVLKQNEMVGLFPEGAIQRGHRDLQPFEPGIGMIALRSKAVIVPTWITGTPIAKGMLAHFLRPSRCVVVFGEPYQPDANQSYDQVAEQLRQKMLVLSGLAEAKQANPKPLPTTTG